MARNELIDAMNKAEASIRASLSGKVKTYTREEIDAIADTLQPPKLKKRKPYNFYQELA